MKDQRKTEIRVGLTVLLGVIILLWILGWAKNFSLTPTENTVKVKFNNTSGLEIGDPVTVNGVRKGFVEDLRIDGESVIVTLKVDNSIHLKEDAKFAVSMLDLMGGKKVEISPGTSQTEIDYNKLQQGLFYADVPQVMSMVGTFQEDFTSTISDIRITLTSLNNYLTDQQLNNDIKSSMSNLSEVTKKLNILIDENRNSLKQLTSNSAELTEEAKKFLETNKEKMNASVDELQSVLKNTDKLIVKLNQFTDEMNAKQNNLGKIIYDEKIYEDLTQSLKQLNELTKLMLQQLKEDGLKIDADIF
ncbi:MAG: ABC transporter substrate-binding protein [Ignavibacteria bacterium RBG_16_34_14]|nr:MAG: ABC transporter substrate-binding protein [Ignavibacteria bacterium RBG_16_34_14]